MTACVNNEGLSGKKVVSATLAGVLAAGMVPAIAFADEAAEATTDEGIDLLIANDAAAFSNGTVVQVTNDGNIVKDPANIKFSTTDTIAPGVTQVKLANTETIVTIGDTSKGADIPSADATTEYFEMKSNGTKGTSVANFSNPTPGKYIGVTKIGGSTAYNTGAIEFSFEIVGKTLEKATIFNKANGNTGSDVDVTKTAFEYNAARQQIGVALDGKELSTGFTVKYRKAGETAVSVNAPEDAGDYVAMITGTAPTYAATTIERPFTVNKLDLTNAEILIDDVTDAADIRVSKINETAVAAGDDLAKQLSVAYKDSQSAVTNGAYTVTVSAADPENKNIMGSQDVTFNKVDTTATITYGDSGDPFEDATFSDPVNIAKQENLFDAGKIKIGYGSETPQATVPSDKYTVTVADKDGKTIPVSDLNKTPGEWYVTVTVDAKAMDYKVGGTAKAKIKVINDAINGDSTLFVKHQGELVTELNSNDAIPVSYTGSNVLNDFEIILQDSKGKVLTEGTDYTVKVTDSKGQEVEEVVAVGTYAVTVESDTYSMDAGTDSFKIEVSAIELTKDNTRIVQSTYKDSEGDDVSFIPYTGDVIAPVVEFTTAADPKAKDAKWTAVPSDVYKLTYTYAEKSDGVFKSAKEMKETGFYKVNLTIPSGTDNYKPGTNIAVADGAVYEVSAKRVFLDVPADAWFAEVVNQAKENKYMSGYSGTQLFGANDSITRADVACVLFNMAGNTPKATDENKKNEQIAYATKFSDVDPSMYYAQAIGWAAKAKVVNGIAGSSNFEPERAISRQEFAAMLANYAKAIGNFKAVEDIDAVLGEYPDGDQVADWAKESIAWAAANKVMGNGGVLNPTAEITRAETAAMTVNYQPKPASEVVIG